MEFHDEFGQKVLLPNGTEIRWRPSVSAMVIRDGALLCVKPKSHGRWEIPGGAMDIGETPFESVRVRF